uniref:Uncharacterized protein n=1 Tax=Tanacetum cinerariifolium TaxID=118510 RepID=A0A6L2J8B2_TANCI|nr:hypothetical protein [Tanacetum cinerariifolium]
MKLRSNAYYGTFDEDVVDHIAKVLEMLNVIKILNVDSHRLRMNVFPPSLVDDARQLWIDKGDGKITTWKELVEKFFCKFYPISCNGDDEMLEESDNWGLIHLNSYLENNETINNIISSDEEWEESDYRNPTNATTNSSFKFCLNAQEKDDIEKVDERSQKKHKGNTLDKAPKSDNQNNERPSKKNPTYLGLRKKKRLSLKNDMPPRDKCLSRSQKLASMSSSTDLICSGGGGTTVVGGDGDTYDGSHGEGYLDLLRDEDGKSDGGGENDDVKSDGSDNNDDVMTNGANTPARGVVVGKGVGRAYSLEKYMLKSVNIKLVSSDEVSFYTLFEEVLDPKKKKEIESWLEDSRIVDSLDGLNEIKYFNTFSALEELEYHDWLLKYPNHLGQHYNGIMNKGLKSRQKPSNPSKSSNFEEGTVTFEKDDEKIIFKMPHNMEAFNHIDFKDINTYSIPSFVLGSNDDHGKTYYSDSLDLGPRVQIRRKKITYKNGAGKFSSKTKIEFSHSMETASRFTYDAVTMTPVMASLEVLRKFHGTILGGRFNQLLHVSSPLLSKPGE